MANQGEAVEVVIDGDKCDVVLVAQREFIIGARNEIGWVCVDDTSPYDFFLAWNGKLYSLSDEDEIRPRSIGEAPTWRALLKETAQALSPETNYGAW